MMDEAKDLLGHEKEVVWNGGFQLLSGYGDNGRDYVLDLWHCLVSQAQHVRGHVGLWGERSLKDRLQHTRLS